jgi:putative ABC transport system permease protein
MNKLRGWLSRLGELFGRGRRERDLAAEMQSHLQLHIDQNLRAGMSAAEARREALMKLGGVEQTKEIYREQRGLPMLETLAQDLRYGGRMLSKNPGFTAVIVLTVALGIGANAAIFSVVHAVLLKPLPYPESDRLVMVWEKVFLPNYQNEENNPSPGNYSDWKSQNTVFEDIGSYRNRSFNLTSVGEPVRIEGEQVSASLFSVLQVNAALGRVFTADDDQPAGRHVVVISDGLWKGRFGSNAQILGKTILLDGQSYSVVGVMPPDFHFPDPDDQLWTPIALTSQDLANHGSHYLLVTARLKRDVTLAQAQEELNRLAQHLTELYPDTNTGVQVNVVALREEIAGPVRPTLVALFGAVGFVLLIVCANVASLLLGRASTRHREIGIRIALGATRTRILRQLLTESSLLALLGCAFGLLFARWGIFALKLLNPPHIPRMDEVQIDTSVFVFSLVISLLAGFVFGVFPALQATRDTLHQTLKEGTRESAGSARLRTRNLLVILETALGVVVMIGAGLLLRSFLILERAPLGFQPQGVLTFRVIPRGERYAQLAGRTAFYQQAIERIEALHGVKSVAAVSFIPLTLSRSSKGFSIEGRVPPAAGQIPMAGYDVVTPGYFESLQIPLHSGRDFSWIDTPQVQRVVIINEAMARTYWPREDPLGKHIKLGAPEDPHPWWTIVGIVGDIREFDVMTLPRPTLYLPVSQADDSNYVLRDWVVRASGDPMTNALSLRAAMRELDPDLPVSRLRSLEQVRSISVAPQRFNLLLFGLFAALALVLAAVGIYGVTAYSVAQRTREIGIRMAMGAQRGNVVGLVLGQGARHAALGVLLGLVGAFGLTRLMESLLYGVRPTDSITFASVSLILGGVALLACYLPAQRAMRVDPMVALRYE